MMIDSSTVNIEITRASSETEEVLKCLKTLYGSLVGTLALDREFGIDWSFLDMPTETAKAMISREIIIKTRKYEPRAKIKEVKWEGDASGKLKPKVVIEIV